MKIKAGLVLGSQDNSTESEVMLIMANQFKYVLRASTLLMLGIFSPSVSKARRQAFYKNNHENFELIFIFLDDGICKKSS